MINTIKMKKYFRLFTVVCLVVLTAVVSCKKPNEDPKPDEKTYADVPFSKITVTSDGETVEGTIEDEKYIRFHFTKAESFSDATLAITVNDGYTLTYPTSLEHIDLQAEPVLNFKDPKNATVKYWLRFSSDAFPIVDETKIHIDGLAAGELLTIDLGTKTFTVKYDKSKLTYENVTLVFEDGALQDGATVKTDLTYDFTNGIEQPLVIDLGGDRTYTVKLDVSDYVKMTPADFGFNDETFKYVDNVDNYPYLKVWRADAVNGVPAYTIFADYLWMPANPWEWDYSWAYDAGGYGGQYQYGWVDAYSFIGDWADDRMTQRCVGPVVIVTVNQEAVEAKMVSNSARAMRLGDATGFITIPGYSDNKDNWDYMLFNEGSVYVPEGGALYRSSIGITPEGKIAMANCMAVNGESSVKQVPFQSAFVDDPTAVAAGATDWNVVSAAWALPWMVRDGVKMGWENLLNNDSERWAISFGQGWNGMYYGHVVIGTTYDNKIGIICNPGGSDNYDGADTNNLEFVPDPAYWKGYTSNQLAWIAYKLGWRDVIVISGQNGEGNGNASTVRINGKSVFQQSDHPYFSPVYDNEGAEVNCAYVLSFDKR